MNTSITKHLMFTKYFFIPFKTSLSIVSHCQTDITLIKKAAYIKNLYSVSSILYDELYMVNYYKHSN